MVRVSIPGACGDLVRNIMCCPAPLADRQQTDGQDLRPGGGQPVPPRTHAFSQLRLDGERAVTAVEPSEAPGEGPLYDTTYLPPKFKIGFAFPGDNCIDIDIGVVPVLDGDGESLRSFTVLVGGGMGKEPHQRQHFPRLAWSPLQSMYGLAIGGSRSAR